jgi:Flagellar protein FlaF
MRSATHVSADTVRNREAEFLIASASRIENIRYTDREAFPHLADALTENLHIWHLITDKLLVDPDRAFSASLCHQVTALCATVLRYTRSALDVPTPAALHILVSVNRELAAEFCTERNS